MAFKASKKLSNLTHEELEKLFHEDCRQELTPANYKLALVEAENKYREEQVKTKKQAAYNRVFAYALRTCCGIVSWREWKKYELNESTRPPVMKKIKAQGLSNEKMTELAGGNRKSPVDGRKTIMGFIEGKY